MYFPGSNNPINLAHFRSDIRLLASLFNNHIISGDFNSRHQFWGCSRSNAAGRVLYDEMCSNQFLIFHPNEPTHYPENGTTPSVLDFFLVSGNLYPQDITVESDLSSDHLPVCYTLTSDLEQSSTQRIVRDYEHADWYLFSAIVQREILMHPHQLRTKADIDNVIQSLSDTISLAFNQSVPLKQVHQSSLTLPDDVKYLIRQRNVIRRRIQRSSNALERDYLKSIRSDLQCRINDSISAIRNDRFSRSLQQINNANISPNRKLFRICKFFKNGSRRLSFLKHNNRKLVTDKEKSEALADQFHNVYAAAYRESSASRLVKRSLRIIQQSSFDPSSIPMISMNDVQTTIHSLCSFKAPGPDEIFNISLKKTPRYRLFTSH